MNQELFDLVAGLERDVWQALVDADADADLRLLADDFLGVYPTGCSDRAGHVGQLVSGPTVSEFEFGEQRFIPLSDTLVLFSYRADFRRPSAPADRANEVMYITSLWQHRDGRWQNVFSQDTPAEPDA